MITSSMSSRLTAEAMPAPSARPPARSPRWRARRSRESALAHTPLDRLAPPLTHDLEQLRLATAVGEHARPLLHRPPAGVGLHAAAASARAARAVALDDHVTDLARRAAAAPRLALEHQPAADAGAPEHAEQRRGGRPAPSANSAWVATSTSLPRSPPAHPSASDRRRQGERPSQSGRLLAWATSPPRLDLARRSDPDAGQPRRLDSAAAAASRSASAIASTTSCGPPSPVSDGARIRAPCDRRDDHRLDLGPTEIDPAVERHRGIIAYKGSSQRWRLRRTADGGLRRAGG